MQPALSVVVSTYNQPAWLALCLAGLACQTHLDFEVLIADDGSGPDTQRVVKDAVGCSRFRIRHIWHEDAGFRKCRILNAAMLQAEADYLVFMDGDCIPREDFLAVHAAARRPGRFLSGGYVKLPRSTSDCITLEAVTRGQCFDRRWLAAHDFPAAYRRIKLTRSRAVATLADACSPARASWNGHNASAWKRDLYRVNGFDERMAYGGEDRELGERLERAGVMGRRIRHRAPVLHLEHARGYVNAADRAVNDRVRADGAQRRTISTEFGLRRAEGVSSD